ncbi:DUF1653 domain-containing protein [Candidatus Woesearchaeota archaeon CG_4_10_14_0_2_um_filter_33_13]|nr:MAG: DUF1653 domain-containing protein [Candidatus Woesearchaeota archaeon CG_4_10_14_0_2_um_filter_33_13]
MTEIKPGKYKHFKGAVYEVLGIAKHSETLDELVLYQHDGQYWVRPVAMFLETIERSGRIMPRFEFIGE